MTTMTAGQVGLPEPGRLPAERHCRKRQERQAQDSPYRDAGDGDGAPPRARAVLKCTRGAPERPHGRDEQRQGDEVEEQIEAMQRGAGLDRVADEGVHGVALDAIDRGRVPRHQSWLAALVRVTTARSRRGNMTIRALESGARPGCS